MNTLTRTTMNLYDSAENLLQRNIEVTIFENFDVQVGDTLYRESEILCCGQEGISPVSADWYLQ